MDGSTRTHTSFRSCTSENKMIFSVRKYSRKYICCTRTRTCTVYLYLRRPRHSSSVLCLWTPCRLHSIGGVCGSALTTSVLVIILDGKSSRLSVCLALSSLRASHVRATADHESKATQWKSTSCSISWSPINSALL